METKEILDNVDCEIAEEIRYHISNHSNAIEELEWIILFCERCIEEHEQGL